MENQTSKSNKKSIEQVTAHQLDGILAEQKFAIIDVRDVSAIENQGRIPGAVNIPLERIQSSFKGFTQEFPGVFSGKKPILFCCTGGVMSYVAALKAQEEGFNDVFNLEGGHSGWLKHRLKDQAA